MASKTNYIASNGSHCPKEGCDSKDIQGHHYNTDDGFVRQDVECLECGHKWQDILLVCDMMDKDGAPTTPNIFPLNQISKWAWIVTTRPPEDGGEYQFHGPFVTDPHDTYWKAVERIHLCQCPGSGPMQEVRIDMSTGQLVTVELDELSVELDELSDKDVDDFDES